MGLRVSFIKPKLFVSVFASSFAARVLAFFALPILAMVLLSGQHLLQQRFALINANYAQAVIALSPQINALVQELQRERGLSSGYTGNKSAGFKPVLKTQRQKTDLAVQEFERSVQSFMLSQHSKGLVPTLETIEHQLSQLPLHRDHIDNFGLDLNEIIENYSSLINQCLSVQKTIGLVITNPKIASQASALVSLQLAKEQAGLERAIGSVGFGRGSFSPDVQTLFTQLGALQQHNLSDFRSLADARFTKQLQEIESAETSLKIEALRKLVYATPANQRPEAPITGVDWFALTTKRIDAMLTLETAYGQHIGQLAHVSAHNALFGIMGSVFMIMMLILLTGFMINRLKQNLLTPMEDLSNTVSQLGKNETLAAVPHLERRDRIGKMAKSLETLRNTLISHFQLLEEDKARKRNLESELPHHKLF